LEKNVKKNNHSMVGDACQIVWGAAVWTWITDGSHCG